MITWIVAPTSFTPLMQAELDARLKAQGVKEFCILPPGSVVVGNTRVCGRLFPIQGEYTGAEPVLPSAIPWWLAEVAYEYYKERFGDEQSLERLAERGGFGREELVKLLRREL